MFRIRPERPLTFGFTNRPDRLDIQFGLFKVQWVRSRKSNHETVAVVDVLETTGAFVYRDETIFTFDAFGALFGPIDFHFSPVTEPETKTTSQGYRYRLEVGRLCRTRERFYWTRRLWGVPGEPGFRVRCYNRIMNAECTLFVYDESAIDQLVNTAAQQTVDDLMGGAK